MICVLCLADFGQSQPAAAPFGSSPTPVFGANPAPFGSQVRALVKKAVRATKLLLSKHFLLSELLFLQAASPFGQTASSSMLGSATPVRTCLAMFTI